jgi:DNA gyrase subunit A
MYDGGYRPDRGFNKCGRRRRRHGQYHPHGDSAIYDALVRMVQPWALRYPLVDGQGNFGSPGNDPAAAPRYTECRMAQLAMEMVRDIDEETVDFKPNYRRQDAQEPVVLPAASRTCWSTARRGSRSAWRRTSRRTTCARWPTAAQWALAHPTPSKEELLDALMNDQGARLPDRRLIMGAGIEDAYRTGRGSIIMRAVVDIEEIQNRAAPAWCHRAAVPGQPRHPDREDRRAGARRARWPASPTSATRRRAAPGSGWSSCSSATPSPRSCSTTSTSTPSCRRRSAPTCWPSSTGCRARCRLDAFVRHWVDHQIEVIQRRTAYRLRKAEERAHILRGYLKALDALDEVIALIRASPTVEDRAHRVDGAARHRRDPGHRDPGHAAAPAGRPGAAEDHRRPRRDRGADPGLQDILAKPERQRSIVSTELAEIVDKFGDDRRTGSSSSTATCPWRTSSPRRTSSSRSPGGYAKRTKTDLYRSQRRGGKGVRGASLRGEDIVEHFFTTTSHHWLLFFTNLGRVYRAKAYELPEGGRDAKGQHVANLMAFQPGEEIAQVLAITDYQQAPYLVLATEPAWSRRPACPSTTRRARVASSRSTCATTTSSSARDSRLPRTTCCWCRARASRCGSTPTTSTCGRWAGRRPASPA